MRTIERSCNSDTTKGGDRWAEIMLTLACLLTVAWIGFTLWLAAEVLGMI